MAKVIDLQPYREHKEGEREHREVDELIRELEETQTDVIPFIETTITYESRPESLLSELDRIGIDPDEFCTYLDDKLFNVGMGYPKLQDLIIRGYEVIFSIKPNMEEAYRSLGLVLIFNEELDLAREICQRGLEIASDSDLKKALEQLLFECSELGSRIARKKLEALKSPQILKELLQDRYPFQEDDE